MPLTAMTKDRAVEPHTTNSHIIKRSIVCNGHKSSVSLEDQFWNCLREIAKSKKLTVSKLVEEIDHHRNDGNLSSEIRIFVLEYSKTALSELRAQVTGGEAKLATIEARASDATQRP
jgi:predicted DNA-binding ribbon-helix-helix protein